jgi:hypothetical protein
MTNTEALSVNYKQTGLEVTAKKNKHMFMSHEQNAQYHHNTEIGSKSLDSKENF